MILFHENEGEVIVRGCGTRKDKGMYLETKLAEDGLDIKDAIFCPPIPDDREPFRAPIPFENDGVVHLLVWIGKEFYPSPIDFIEEARRFGISRRIPKTKKMMEILKSLSDESCMFFVHQHAIIENWEELKEKLLEQGITKNYCRKGNHKEMEKINESCLFLHHYLMEKTGDREEKPNEYGKWVERRIASTSYFIPNPIEKLDFEPVYKTGIFFFAPITNIAYVSKDGKVEDVVRELAEEIDITVYKE